MNPEEGKEDERFSAYRRWKLNMITIFKMWKKTAERKLFSAQRMWTNGFSYGKADTGQMLGSIL